MAENHGRTWWVSMAIHMFSRALFRSRRPTASACRISCTCDFWWNWTQEGSVGSWAHPQFTQDFRDSHRIHGAAIYGVPWIKSIYPLDVSIYTSTMDPSWDMKWSPDGHLMSPDVRPCWWHSQRLPPVLYPFDAARQHWDPSWPAIHHETMMDSTIKGVGWSSDHLDSFRIAGKSSCCTGKWSFQHVFFYNFHVIETWDLDGFGRSMQNRVVSGCSKLLQLARDQLALRPL